MTRYSIARDDLRSADVLELLSLHLDEMHQWSPSSSVHALPVEQLRSDEIAFFAVRDDNRLAAIGALRHLDPRRGEIKSMRAAPGYRGRGAGEALLIHLLAEARTRDYIWVGLETGRPEPFRPAVRLYEKFGFVECEPFGDYLSDDFSLCMEKWL